jgi:tetratricopeptide (TPR) repeat protein
MSLALVLAIFLLGWEHWGLVSRVDRLTSAVLTLSAHRPGDADDPSPYGLATRALSLFNHTDLASTPVLAETLLASAISASLELQIAFESTSWTEFFFKVGQPAEGTPERTWRRVRARWRVALASLMLARTRGGEGARRALSMLDIAAAEDPDSEEAAFAVAFHSRKIKVATVAQLADKHPGSARLRALLAARQAESGLSEEALTSAAQAEAIDPAASAPLLGAVRGDALVKLGKTQEAAEAYIAALKADPRCGRCAAAVGILAAEAGQAVEAAAFLTRALEVGHETAAVHYQLGNAHLSLANLTTAEAHYRASLEVENAPLADGEKNPFTCNNLAVAVRLQDRLKEAIEIMEACTASHPEYTTGWANLARLHHAAGSPKEAHKACATAQSQDQRYSPQDPKGKSFCVIPAQQQHEEAKSKGEL